MPHKVKVPKELKLELKKLKKEKKDKVNIFVKIFKIKDIFNIEDEADIDECGEEEISPSNFNKIKNLFVADADDTDYDTNVQSIKKEKLKPTFYELLIKHIDTKELKDSDVYKKAYVDRRLFSKIRSGHKPNIKTVIRLGMALELNMEEFIVLLNSCHYMLYDDEYFDIAIKYFIKNKIYDINEANDILYSCKLELLTE